MSKIVGILNCTPDSYYDGGKYLSPEKAILWGIQMYEEGADILDIGGESTRPFAKSISQKEEIRRVMPVVKTLKKELSIPLSIDTRHPEVAADALQAGASIINDVTGLEDRCMRKLIAKTGVKAIVMHMQGNPKSMQKNPSYPRGVVPEIMEWFEKRLAIIHKEGISKEQIIIDPGIGFGKNVDHNLEIIAALPTFCSLGYPVMIGLSRKSFMQKILKKQASEVLSTTIALNTMSAVYGASLIRVHDVIEHKEVIDLLRYWKKTPMKNF